MILIFPIIVMLIVSEIGEAMDADRRQNWWRFEAIRYINNESSDEFFESVIKDTFPG